MSADAVAVVEGFLSALERGEVAAATALLAPNPVLRFPGGVEHADLGSLAAASATRYRRVGKVREQYESLVGDDGRVTVISTGTLHGENLHGVRFAGVRYVDRFRLRDGLIEEQDVWNDLAETGVLGARTPQDVPAAHRVAGGLLVRRSATSRWEGALRGGSGRVELRSQAGTGLPVSLEQRKGDQAGATSPEELLAAAHASCFAMALRGALDAEGAATHELAVDATCVLRIDGREWTVEAVDLTVSAPAVPDDVLGAAVRLAEQRCAISAALGPHVAVRAQVVRPDPVSGSSA